MEVTGPQSFVLYTEPTAKGRPRFSRIGAHVRTYTPSTTRGAEDSLRWLLRAEGAKRYDKPAAVRLVLRFFLVRPKSAPKRVVLPTTRPDLDQYLKLVLDAGNELLWQDDSQVVAISASKQYGDVSRIEIETEEV